MEDLIESAVTILALLFICGVLILFVIMMAYELVRLARSKRRLNDANRMVTLLSLVSPSWPDYESMLKYLDGKGFDVGP